MSPTGTFGDEAAPLRPVDDLIAATQKAVAERDALQAAYDARVTAAGDDAAEHPDEDLGGGEPPPDGIHDLDTLVVTLRNELRAAVAAQQNPAVVDLWNANEAAAVAVQKLSIRHFNGEDGLDGAIADAQQQALATGGALQGVIANVDVGGLLAAPTSASAGASSDALDTGHHDDAHAFGWGTKQSVTSPPGFGWTSSKKVIVPAIVAALLGIGAVIVFTGGGGDDDSTPAADALETGTSVAATEVLPIVDKLTITFARPVSTYAVVARDPGGGELRYRWTMTGESCGTPKTPWTQNGASVTWSHGDAAPDSCKHVGTDHNVDVGLLIETTGGPNDGAKLYCALHGTEKQVVAPAKACSRA
ncbi:MAG: hypothetical protein V7636_248 [Actinomycetota bacterium]|jgi:hypothetical protein